MSTGEALFLALVLFAVFAFMATLAWVTYGGTPRPARHRGSQGMHQRQDRQPAGVR